MSFKYFFAFLVLYLLFSACNTSDKNVKRYNDECNDNMQIKYAKYFKIYSFKKYKILNILNPWNKAETLQRIVIIPSNSTFDSSFSNEYQIVKLPIHKIAIQSVSNIGFLGLLDKLDLINGVSDPELIYNQTISKAYQNHKISNIGTSMQISMEKILHGNFDLFIATSYNGNDQYASLKGNTSVLFNVDWMENHPLGRAEWIKCIALFTEQEDRADSIFSTIESQYINLMKSTDSITYKPKILVATPFKGTWYQPGGNSFKAILYKNAGADYYWSKDSSLGSLPLSLEKVFEKQWDANIWIDIAANTKSELLQQDSRFALFESFKNNRLYNFKKAINLQGGNNYWEEGVCRPDLVLNDLISIFHPNLVSENYNSHYYKEIK